MENKYWNYRVMVTETVEGPFFSVREVHYINHKPEFYSEKEAELYSEFENHFIDEFEEQIEMIKEAFKKPVLYTGKKFPKEFKIK